ncbi:MAG: YbaB/EbfC family nucleoid-associated protein, partial [Rickettsiales bacterium]|nr:YbaB/EbfC family nucleoid-associated protein [Rickettsiales bacterium]
MDMDTLMKQAREMQEKVTAAQEMLAEMSVKGIAGNGFVIVELDGKYNLRKLTISPELKNNPVDDIS